MSAPALVFITLAAIWPFGHHRKHQDEATGTIQDLNGREVQVDTAAPIDGSEAKAMESYRAFLDLASDDPVLKAEAMRRLADLQLDTADAEQLQANVQSLGVVGSTIEMYKKLLQTYPNYPKNDLVLYQLARAYEADGRIDDSLATLDRLIAKYPRTTHLEEAQFRRGETLFVMKRYRDAERAYAHVLEKGASSALLRAGAVQARVVAVQATTVRRQSRVVLRFARSPARHRQRRNRRSRSRRGLRCDGSRAAGADRRYLPGAVDRVLVSRRSEGRVAVLQAARRAALCVPRLHEPRRSVSRPAALPGCRGRLPRVRRARPLPCESAAAAGRGHRGVQEGRLCRPRTRGQRELRRRPTVLAVRTGRGTRSSSSQRSSGT